MRKLPEVLIHQPAIHYTDGSLDMYQTAVPNESQFCTSNEEEKLALAAMHRLIDIERQTRRGQVPGIDVHTTNTSALSAEHRAVLQLTHDITTMFHLRGMHAATYGYASLPEFTNNISDISSMCMVEQRRRFGRTSVPMYLRLEESLAVQAARIARVTGVKSSSREHWRVAPTVDHLPPREAFTAATVQDQLGLADSVVRIIPFWMKRQELGARALLQQISGPNLPVISIVAGKSGDITKIIDWSFPAYPSTFSKIVPELSTRKSHLKSSIIAQQIQAETSSEHLRLYNEQHTGDQTGELRPKQLLAKSIFVTECAKEFLSRTLLAAPLYEQTDSTPAARDASLLAAATLIDLFSQNFQHRPTESRRSELSMQHFKGVGTNDVTYIHAVLASRPEEDAVLFPDTQIDLVAHYVVEQLSKHDRRAITESDNPNLALQQILSQHSVRYALIEARRTKDKIVRPVHIAFGTL